MRYNFKRCSGKEWYRLIKSLRRRGLTFLEVTSEELYNADCVNQVWNAYYSRTTTSCKIIYYEFNGKWQKRLRQINFKDKEIDPVKCVLTFKGIANKFNELVDYEPNKKYTNGVYTYYKHSYEGLVTVLDMNSAYNWALMQPLADYTTRTECTLKEVYSKEYDYYCFENSIYCEMFYKEDTVKMQSASLWADVKIYGYRSKLYYQKTCKELYRLKTEVDKDKYKNVVNIAVGCMHKRNGKQNNSTIAASLYAWFAYYIDSLVHKFENKGYNVIMVTTDSIKIKGNYHPEDNLVTIGNGLGEFKYEYIGEAKYMSVGHYLEDREKWKGKPEYMIKGFSRCKFVEDIEKEKSIYETYAII